MRGRRDPRAVGSAAANRARMVAPRVSEAGERAGAVYIADWASSAAPDGLCFRYDGGAGPAPCRRSSPNGGGAGACGGSGYWL